MLNHHEKIRFSFDKKAESYAEFSSLQRQVGANLLAKIPKKSYETMLDLGCGNGQTSEFLAHEFCYNQLILLDISPSLLDFARKKLSSNTLFIEGNFDFLPLKKPIFDLIFSNMALQWSSDFSSTLARIFSLLKPGGTLAFTVPLPGTLAEIKAHASVNSFVAMTEIQRILSTSGAKMLVSETEKIILHFPSAIHALRSIKEVGANYVRDKKVKSLRGKSYIHAMNFTQLTYEIGYVIAKKII